MDWKDAITYGLMVLTAGGSAFVWWDARRLRHTQLKAAQAETKEKESEASIKAIEATGDALVYWQDIAKRQDSKLVDQDHRISGLENLVGQLTRDLGEAKTEALKAKRYMMALEYLVDKVRDTFTVDVQIAERIARGELSLPNGNIPHAATD